MSASELESSFEVLSRPEEADSELPSNPAVWVSSATMPQSEGTPAAQKHPEYMKRMLPIQQEGADTLLVPAVFPQASNKSSLKPAESWALPCHFAILSSVSRGFATMDPVGGKGTVEKTLPSDQKPKRIIEVPLIMTAARHMLEWCYGVAPKAADLKLVEAFQLALLSRTLGVPGLAQFCDTVLAAKLREPDVRFGCAHELQPWQQSAWQVVAKQGPFDMDDWYIHANMDLPEWISLALECKLPQFGFQCLRSLLYKKGTDVFREGTAKRLPPTALAALGYAFAVASHRTLALDILTDEQIGLDILPLIPQDSSAH